MSTRRHSRTPAVLSKEQQELLVSIADETPEVRESLEQMLGVKWESLTFQKKVSAVQTFQEMGYALGSLAGSARGVRDWRREVELKTESISVQEQVDQQRSTIENLTEERDTLRAQLDTIRKTKQSAQKKAAS